jgi:nucleoside-diphosphate-sugar epimerase
MRILVTGGAGCLGSNLIEHWLPQGHDILVIDNFATGQRETLPGGVPKLELVAGTIADRVLVDRIFAEFKPTHVVHSAAAYKDPDDWREDVATNVLGSVNVVSAARAAKVERFINFQTSLCYGAPQGIPIPVDHACRPVASYGISKTAGEAYVATAGVPFVSVRLASVIGPRLTIGAIPTFYQRLKAGKSVFCTTAVRDFLAMSDFLSFMDVALKPGAPTGVFNLGPGRGHSIKDVLVAVATAIGVTVPDPIEIRPVAADDVETVVLDPSATTAAFGWRAKVSFEEAIAGVVRWYDAHGISAIHTHLKAASSGSGPQS